jgi:hypothetical protein
MMKKFTPGNKMREKYSARQRFLAKREKLHISAGFCPIGASIGVDS